MTTLERALNWRPITPFYYGWLLLAVSSLGAFVATTVAGVVFGGIQGLIFGEMGWSRSTVGITAAVGVWLSGLVAPFVGRLTDRYGPRWLMPVGTIVLGVCLYLLGGVNSIWAFFLLAVVARDISQPLLIGVVPRTMAVNFFDRRRNLALALTGIFRPFGSAINIQIITAISVEHGWRAAFRYLGYLSLLVTIPLFILVRRRPEDIGLLPDGDATPRPGANPSGLPAGRSGAGTEVSPAAQWTAKDALRTKAFWLVGFTIILSVTANSGIGFNMVPYIREQAGISIIQAAGVLSLSSFLSLANLVWAHLADKFTPRRCIVGAMASTTGIIVYLFMVNSLWSAYVFGIAWGLFAGGMDVLIAMVVAQYFGRESYGTILGALRPFEALGLGLGLYLGTAAYDLTGSYTVFFAAALVANVLAAALIMMARPPTLPRRGLPAAVDADRSG